MMTMTAAQTVRGTGPGQVSERGGRRWQVVAAVEVILAAAVVVADLWLPTLVLIAMAAVSMAARRRGLASLGLHRPARPWRLAGLMLGFAVAWTLMEQALLIPALDHVAGQRQDTSGFADLEGDAGRLVVLLLLGWTLAAFGEELAFRGYLFTRLREAVPGRSGLVVALLVSSLLFGLLHTEQGVAGVVLTSVDAVAFGVLRLRLGTVWAPVLAHGFSNTIGFVTFFLVGPIVGFW
jgi:membrane protease YdiL (CAAX protease family)